MRALGRSVAWLILAGFLADPGLGRIPAWVVVNDIATVEILDLLRESGRDRPSRSMNILLRALGDGHLSVSYLQSLHDKAFDWRRHLGAEYFDTLTKTSAQRFTLSVQPGAVCANGEVNDARIPTAA